MAQRQGDSVLIRGVRVFDGAALSGPTSVLVEGTTITAVDPELGSTGRHVVDGANGALLPGLIEAHVHLHGPYNLEQLARAGITTALDVACWPRDLVDALRNRRGLTDIRSAGLPATAPGSRHSQMPGRPDAALVAAPAEAESFVSDRLAEGSDYIKLIADAPGLGQATLDALVAAAHQHDKLTVAHAATLVLYRMALAARADVIAHAPLDAVLDEETLAEMAQVSCVAVPTLTMMTAVAQRLFGALDAAATAVGPGYHNAQRSVRLLHQAGVPILAGTDANASPGAPAAIPDGESLHDELEVLVSAGLRPVDALTAATSLPAPTLRPYRPWRRLARPASRPGSDRRRPARRHHRHPPGRARLVRRHRTRALTARSRTTNGPALPVHRPTHEGSR